MRPQDVAVLIKILSVEDQAWQLSSLSVDLSISISEISESLNRSKIAKLIDHDKKKVHRQNLMEFLEHGIKYVFPIQPGSMVRGVPTAHTHPQLKKQFISELNFVWPDNNGQKIGLLIEPLYLKQIQAAKKDDRFYLLMSLIDIIRVGKLREVKYAISELKKWIIL